MKYGQKLKDREIYITELLGFKGPINAKAIFRLLPLAERPNPLHEIKQSR
ncbi:hypothetical protein MUS1_08190 [Marinomonas ushuaiensis DSM 15871]|uniref:Uncharacterized protein n=1 Tax=Marinomonas ushuaiensis DSM 15871 TaxID=1122207 RepID=X7E7P2_9GAMM|nr:hypothetical protein MUS1_08190 [Marinomonas ushuaiensis DSM 15871]